MKKIYDWGTNTLEYSDKYGNHYILELRGTKNIIKGCSGTGKTFLYESLKKLASSLDNVSKYDLSNIALINKENTGKTSQYKNRLLIIDDADLILDESRVKKINEDVSNRYLFFCRVPIGLEVSPNHEADLVVDSDGITRMEYRFSIKGWH